MNAGFVRAALPLAAVLAVVGLGVATYLTITHYGDQPIACNGIGDCEYVNSSEYAKLAGFPVAILGAGAYAAMFLLIGLAWLRGNATALALAWAIGLASFAFSVYLTYIELYVIDAICVYCVVSATIMTALFAVLSACVLRARDEIFGAAELALD